MGKGLDAKDIHKEIIPVCSGTCLSRKAVHNWVKKFSEGRSKVADNARPGRHVEIATEATVRRVEELIRDDRRIMIDSVATALGCSYGRACSIMHDILKIRKVCARWVPRELKDREELTECVCSCNIYNGMQMKEMSCLIALLLPKNHGCITTNQKHSALQCNGSIPVHLQPESLRLRH
jgi:hypothetical protein